MDSRARYFRCDFTERNDFLYYHGDSKNCETNSRFGFVFSYAKSNLMVHLLLAFLLPLMPWPASISEQTGSLPITSSFSIATAGAGSSDPRVQAAVERAYTRLTRQTGIPLSPKEGTPTLLIIVESSDHKGPQKLGDNERYSLAISGAQARLSADYPLGALRSLETLLQLVQQNGSGFFIPAVTIQDEPRFPWRGLSLDVSRHFIPIDGVKRTIDGLAAVKLNVLHWHLSDDQGFRVESKKYPRLQQYGSSGLYYTQAEVRDVIAYARDRGVRIVPEFDMPGHSQSWLPGYPKLGARSGSFELYPAYVGYSDVMDPTKDYTYHFLEGFIGEMAKLFPDEYFHIGGDEVGSREWKSSPKIRAFMRKHHLANASQLQMYFNQRVLKIVSKQGKHLEGWDEVLQPDLPKSIVIESWRGQESLWKAARNGYGVILSAGYYLNLMRPAADHYAVDPLRNPPADLAAEQLKLILGGEAAMWEELCTAENLDSRLWPRLAAIAERFWSPASVTDTASMYSRLEATNRWLEWLGLAQRSNLELMRQRLAGTESPISLNRFAEILEPIKGYSRHASQYTPATPLNRLVDAIAPESEVARKFQVDVDEYLAGARTAERSALLREQLSKWSDNAVAIRPLLRSNSLLNEDLPIADQVVMLCKFGQDAITHLDGNQPMKRPDFKSDPQAEMLIQIAPAIQKLIGAVTSN
jgi:hexosaminidase